jgi:hypothetical protein
LSYPLWQDGATKRMKNRIQNPESRIQKREFGVARSTQRRRRGDPLRRLRQAQPGVVDFGLRICPCGEGEGWRSICGSAFGAAADGDIRAPGSGRQKRRSIRETWPPIGWRRGRRRRRAVDWIGGVGSVGEIGCCCGWSEGHSRAPKIWEGGSRQATRTCRRDGARGTAHPGDSPVPRVLCGYLRCYGLFGLFRDKKAWGGGGPRREARKIQAPRFKIQTNPSGSR